MNKLNSKQFDAVEELIEHLLCEHCDESNEDKDCSSCEIYNQMKINMLKGVRV